ncbi:hypothetical protein, partial [Burkholderia dolosa]
LFAEPRFLHDKVSPAASPLTLQWDTLEGEGQITLKSWGQFTTAKCVEQVSCTQIYDFLTIFRFHVVVDL